MTDRYFDRLGRPITSKRWSQLLDDRSYAVIEQTVLPGVRISTVWLGLNHQWSPGGRPLIFETMVFYDDGREEEQRRYSTETEARLGHELAVSKQQVTP